MKRDDQFNNKQLEKVRAQYQNLQAAMTKLKNRNLDAMSKQKDSHKKAILQWKQKYEKAKAEIADMKHKAGL